MTFRIDGQPKYELESFMMVVKQVVVNFINKQVKLLKLKLTGVCSFEKPHLQKEDQFIVKEGYFHSLNEVVTISTGISGVYGIMLARIFERIGNFQGEESSWIFKEIRYLDISIGKCEPMSGLLFIELPVKLAKKRAIINV